MLAAKRVLFRQTEEGLGSSLGVPHSLKSGHRLPFLLVSCFSRAARAAAHHERVGAHTGGIHSGRLRSLGARPIPGWLARFERRCTQKSDRVAIKWEWTGDYAAVPASHAFWPSKRNRANC